MFPISWKVTFPVCLFFVLFNAKKTVSKLTLHHMGKIFNIRFGKIRFGIWRVTVLKSFILFLPRENFWMDLRFLCSGRFTTCALRRDRVYCLSICVEISRSTRVPVRGNKTGRLVKFAENESKKGKPDTHWEKILLLKIWCENFNSIKSYGSVFILGENTAGA